jgi:hypothetical protein
VSKAYPGTRKLDVKAGGAGGPDADGQGALDLGFRHRRALGRDDFILSDSNAAAARIVAAPSCWPGGRLALIGPEGSGKTHLARCFMAETGAACVEAPALRDPDVPALLASGGVAIEAADRLAAPEAERALFHLMNLARSWPSANRPAASPPRLWISDAGAVRPRCKESSGPESPCA